MTEPKRDIHLTDKYLLSVASLKKNLYACSKGKFLSLPKGTASKHYTSQLEIHSKVILHCLLSQKKSCVCRVYKIEIQVGKETTELSLSLNVFVMNIFGGFIPV